MGTDTRPTTTTRTQKAPLMFTLYDLTQCLDAETFRTIEQATIRTGHQLWKGRPWVIYGPDGHPARRSR
ncbi:hypothetical protein [Gordonia sp. (in: high G+C Gram-positive bacteria)]|uniref:hypothetical protein n=1 Tax=Gordonia sp. (in: high G+C Gram-positive bacteria) TaxID=84139 RepID=UPI003341F117